MKGPTAKTVWTVLPKEKNADCWCFWSQITTGAPPGPAARPQAPLTAAAAGVSPRAFSSLRSEWNAFGSESTDWHECLQGILRRARCRRRCWSRAISARRCRPDARLSRSKSPQPLYASALFVLSLLLFSLRASFFIYRVALLLTQKVCGCETKF